MSESAPPELAALEVLAGEWTLEVSFAPDAPKATVGFEWMPGGRFLVERWQVPVPEAPDGLAVIGYDEGRGTLLQHYFDTRGVARVYEMELADGVWRLERTQPDFAPLDFAQRYTGRFTEDGTAIEGTWEINHGDAWEKDFDLTYRRAG